MTAETLKPFLSATATTNGYEKSTKFFKNHKNLLILAITCILLMFCFVVSGLQMYNSKRINTLEQDVGKLKSFVDGMRKHLGFDLFDEINEFESDYHQHRNHKDEIDLDDNVVKETGDKNKFDDIGNGSDEDNDEDDMIIEDDDDDDDDDDEEFGEDSTSGNGMLDDYDDSLEDEDDVLDELTDDTSEADDKKDDNNIYKDSVRRKTRSIAGLTEQGIPIVDEAYVPRRNRTKPKSTHVNDFVTSILIGKDNENDPKLKLRWDSNRDINSPRRELHNERNSNKQHNFRHHHNSQTNINRFGFAAVPKHLDQIKSTSPSSSIQSRRSRVMHTEDKAKAFRQVVRKDSINRFQEHRTKPEQFVESYQRHQQQQAQRRNLKLRNGKRNRNTAVHFHGDSAVGFRHYNHEAKTELNKNEYISWKAANWVGALGMDRFFSMDNSGNLTINDHGLFFIYAQVSYSDVHDTNGYVISHNNEAQFQCTTMTHTTTRVTKTNSCFTSGMLYIRNGDKIRIEDIGTRRTVLLEPTKSYFGMYKINLSNVGNTGSEDVNPGSELVVTRDVEKFDEEK